jgi:hypothetical protein
MSKNISLPLDGGSYQEDFKETKEIKNVSNEKINSTIVSVYEEIKKIHSSYMGKKSLTGKNYIHESVEELGVSFKQINSKENKEVQEILSEMTKDFVDALRVVMREKHLNLFQSIFYVSDTFFEDYQVTEKQELLFKNLDGKSLEINAETFPFLIIEHLVKKRLPQGVYQNTETILSKSLGKEYQDRLKQNLEKLKTGQSNIDEKVLESLEETLKTAEEQQFFEKLLVDPSNKDLSLGRKIFDQMFSPNQEILKEDRSKSLSFLSRGREVLQNILFKTKDSFTKKVTSEDQTLENIEEYYLQELEQGSFLSDVFDTLNKSCDQVIAKKIEQKELLKESQIEFDHKLRKLDSFKKLALTVEGTGLFVTIYQVIHNMRYPLAEGAEGFSNMIPYVLESIKEGDILSAVLAFVAMKTIIWGEQFWGEQKYLNVVKGKNNPLLTKIKGADTLKDFVKKESMILVLLASVLGSSYYLTQGVVTADVIPEQNKKDIKLVKELAKEFEKNLPQEVKEMIEKVKKVPANIFVPVVNDEGYAGVGGISAPTFGPITEKKANEIFSMSNTSLDVKESKEKENKEVFVARSIKPYFALPEKLENKIYEKTTKDTTLKLKVKVAEIVTLFKEYNIPEWKQKKFFYYLSENSRPPVYNYDPTWEKALETLFDGQAIDYQREVKNEYTDKTTKKIDETVDFKRQLEIISENQSLSYKLGEPFFFTRLNEKNFSDLNLSQRIIKSLFKEDGSLKIDYKTKSAFKKKCLSLGLSNKKIDEILQTLKEVQTNENIFAFSEELNQKFDLEYKQKLERIDTVFEAVLKRYRTKDESNPFEEGSPEYVMYDQILEKPFTMTRSTDLFLRGEFLESYQSTIKNYQEKVSEKLGDLLKSLQEIDQKGLEIYQKRHKYEVDTSEIVDLGITPDLLGKVMGHKTKLRVSVVRNYIKNNELDLETKKALEELLEKSKKPLSPGAKQQEVLFKELQEEVDSLKSNLNPSTPQIDAEMNLDRSGIFWDRLTEESARFFEILGSYPWLEKIISSGEGLVSLDTTNTKKLVSELSMLAEDLETDCENISKTIKVGLLTGVINLLYLLTTLSSFFFLGGFTKRYKEKVNKIQTKLTAYYNIEALEQKLKKTRNKEAKKRIENEIEEAKKENIRILKTEKKLERLYNQKNNAKSKEEKNKIQEEIDLLVKTIGSAEQIKNLSQSFLEAYQEQANKIKNLLDKVFVNLDQEQIKNFLQKNCKFSENSKGVFLELKESFKNLSQGQIKNLFALNDDFNEKLLNLKDSDMVFLPYLKGEYRIPENFNKTSHTLSFNNSDKDSKTKVLRLGTSKDFFDKENQVYEISADKTKKYVGILLAKKGVFLIDKDFNLETL